MKPFLQVNLFSYVTMMLLSGSGRLIGTFQKIPAFLHLFYQKFTSRRKLIEKFSVFLLVILPATIHSQSGLYRIETIPLTGMFSDFSGTCILMDSDGFMWFGTTNGLFRYDGADVNIYRHIPYDSTSLSNDIVNCLIEDSSGILWVGTNYGLNRFDKHQQSFKIYKNETRKPPISYHRNYIDDVVEDKEGYLWLATFNGVSRFDRRSGTFRNYEIRRNDSAFNKDPLRAFGISHYLSRQNIIVAFFEQGYCLYNSDIDDFTKIEPPGLVMHEKGGNLMYSNNFSIQVFNNESQPNEQPVIITVPLRFTVDGSGNIWVSNMQGISSYGEGINPRFQWKYPEQYTDTPDYNQIMGSIYVDKEGIIWFFTKNGIHKIIKNYRNFKVYDSDPTNNSFVDCIVPESKNTIWFGALNGIYSLDRISNTYTLHYGVPVDDPTHPDAVETMFLDKSGTLWIGMTFQGLFSLVRSDGPVCQFRRYSPTLRDRMQFTGSPLRDIRPIFEDSQSRLWVNSLDLIHIFDREDNCFIQVELKPADHDETPVLKIRHETASGGLVATGPSGVYIIEPPLMIVSEMKREAVNVNRCMELFENGGTRPFSGIQTSYLDSRGYLWLGVYLHGLKGIRDFEKQLKSGFSLITETYTMEDGLPSNIIYSIIEDDRGNLWMGTENGLSKFDPASGSFTNYSVRHGLPINRFRDESVARGMDGELFFGTRKGMIAFHPDSMQINDKEPVVRLTSFQLFNNTIVPGEQSVLKKSITYTERIELEYNQNSLSFKFASLNYIQPELNQYRYYLEGFESDWVYSGNRNSASYTNLKPGKYVFRVSGSNNDGIWNDEGTGLNVIILPPPWQTWYAYLLYGFMLLGIIIWYRRFLHNRTRLRMAVEVEKIEKAKLQEMDQMKSRFFANISHEFRTPLTLILGPLERIEGSRSGIIPFKKELVDTMRRNARRLLSLINQLLDISKLETGNIAMEVSEGNLGKFVRTILQSFISLAESKKINYKYNLPETSRRVYYDPDKVEKIITNLLSNAFKYAYTGGCVSFRMNYLQKGNHGAIQSDESGPVGFAEIIISDTGKGIPSDKQERIFERFYQVSDADDHIEGGTGVGLALTKELVDLYRGEIQVDSDEGKGSTFTVKLPVCMEHFNKEEIVEPEGDPGEKPDQAFHDFRETEYPERKAGKEVDVKKGSPVILVVEDNADLRKYISGNLEVSYRILVAENGKTGLELAIDYIPDLIISDLMMPVMDGVEMCRQLKQDERTNHIPVIMLTARADRDSRITGFETGADDYLVKPFDAEELRVRARNLVEMRRKLREKFRREIITEPVGEETITPEDRLLQKILDLLNKHMNEPEFNTDNMSSELNMSRMQMYRKINALTGYSPKELLRTIRLKKAASLFYMGHTNITQVMYQVGFNNHSHFAKCFRRLYQANPSEYIKGKNQ